MIPKPIPLFPPVTTIAFLLEFIIYIFNLKKIYCNIILEIDKKFRLKKFKII